MADLGVCIVCHVAAAERLCDRRLGFGGKVDETGPAPVLVKDIERLYTCDAPLCVGCTHVESQRHECGEAGCTIETFDVCPNHVGVRDSLAFLTDAGADALRAKARILVVP